MQSSSSSSGQLSLLLESLREYDRNFKQGGRSFYFFDFDDNLVHLDTKIILFHKKTKVPLEVSTRDFAKIQSLVNSSGNEWSDYEVLDKGVEGSFKNFREIPNLDPSSEDQPLIRDFKLAIENPFLEWRGPSWDFFQYAVSNNRPISIITARGHHPYTIRRALGLLLFSRDLSYDPNYLSLYPVSNPETRILLNDHDYKLSISELKKRAIKQAVSDAFHCYGINPYHRFGMSDDDPSNVALIKEAFEELKVLYPENAFYVINTHDRKLIKEEILNTKKSSAQNSNPKNSQLKLFSS